MTSNESWLVELRLEHLSKELDLEKSHDDKLKSQIFSMKEI
jgi:hypothetical protein